MMSEETQKAASSLSQSSSQGTASLSQSSSLPSPSSSQSQGLVAASELQLSGQPTASPSTLFGHHTPTHSDKVQYTTPVKMYSPVPLQSQSFGPSPAKRPRGTQKKISNSLDAFQEMLATKFGEFDTHLKSALYSVLQKNTEEATATLERVRRLMKASLMKSEIMVKQVNKEIESEIDNLTSENLAVERELNETKIKLNELTKDYVADIFKEVENDM